MSTRVALIEPAPRSRGFTLIELIIFVAIVSVGIAGILLALNTATSKSADPLILKQATAAAEGMLEEILLKAYSNPSGGFSSTPSTQANRSQFDDLGDYDGYNQLGVYPTSGSVYPGLENYRVQVSVGSPLAAIGNQAATARLITVTVTDPGGRSYSLSGYRSDY